MKFSYYLLLKLSYFCGVIEFDYWIKGALYISWVEVSLSHIWFGNTFFHSVGTFSFITIIFRCLFILAVLGFQCCWALSLVAASRGDSAVQCTGFPLRRLLLPRSTGSKVHRPSSCSAWATCSEARGIFPARDQTCVSCLGSWTLYHWVTRAAPVDTF